MAGYDHDGRIEGDGFQQSGEEQRAVNAVGLPVGQALATGIPLDDPSFRPSCPACCLGFVAIFVGLPCATTLLLNVISAANGLPCYELISFMPRWFCLGEELEGEGEGER